MPRRRILVLTFLAVLAVAIPASAQTTFSDVSSGNVHRTQIGQVADAGISDGCGGGRYCPQRALQRDQMASFFTRGAGHAVSDDSVTTLVPGDGDVNGVPVSVDVTGPGVSGGSQQVVLQGSVSVYADGAVDGCPCEVEAFIYRARGELQGPTSWSVLAGDPASSGASSVSVPVTWATTIDSGRAEEYRVAVFVDGTQQSSLRAEGTLTAVTAPFGNVPG
jgi:hypothetical protein